MLKIDAKRIWLISDTHLGVRTNSREWMDTIEDYFLNHFIPIIKKEYRPGDVLVHCGDVFDSRQSINLYVLNKGMSIFEILGWLGSICLAICGIPQAWQSFKDKHSHGISWGFVLLWAFGEVFALAYVYDKLDLPLLLNYATNILILAVILYYKVKPQNKLEL